MKHASTSKLICIQRQLVSQINKAKDLFKKSKSGTAMKRKNSTCFWPLPRDCLKQIKPSGKFLEFWGRRTLVSIWLLLSKKLCFVDGYASQGTLLAANLKICTNLVVVCLCSSISESWTYANEVEIENGIELLVGFLEGLSFAGRVGLTSITGLAKLRNMPHTSKGKATNWCYSVALTPLVVRQNLLDPRIQITFSPESL